MWKTRSGQATQKESSARNTVCKERRWEEEASGLLRVTYRELTGLVGLTCQLTIKETRPVKLLMLRLPGPVKVDAMPPAREEDLLSWTASTKTKAARESLWNLTLSLG
jgi:hypothetical protein